MTQKVKVSVSIDRSYLEELDRVSKMKRVNRSALIEEVIEVWRKERLNAALKEGYKAMAKEDKEFAEKNLISGTEALNE